MTLKNIPPINMILFLVTAGIITAGIIGIIKYVKASDNLNNNYVESSFNASRSKYYTDSLSKTSLSELGELNIRIYDSIENMRYSFVQCSISTHQEKYHVNDVKNKVLNTLLTIFPYESWRGEFKYTVSHINEIKGKTIPLHPIQFEMETGWPD